MADLGIFIKTFFDSKGVKAAQKSLGGVAKKGKEAANNIKSSFSGLNEAVTGQLSGLAAGFTIGAIATGLSNVAIGSFKAAEAAKTATSAFNSLSGGANIAKVNLMAMERATRGLIGETEQMKIANQLLGMNIVQTADELEQVVGVSRRLGKEFRGLGAKDAAEEFAIMIANMSVARLDTFGLSSGRVKVRILELMAATKGMTREAAFLQATIEEAENTISRLGPELTTSADEVQRLGGAWTNLQAAMGKAAEETGIVKSLITAITDDVIKFQAAFFDESPETQIKSLNVQLAEEEERLETLKSRGDAFFGIFSAQIPGAEENISSLKSELEGLNATQEKSIALAKKQQEAFQAAIRGEEIAAENLAKREAGEKKLLEVQEQFSRDIIALQSDTQDSLSDSRETFDDNSLQAAEDSAKAIAKIRARFTKNETKVAKRALKNSEKIDSNLKKSLLKSEQTEGKKIAKAQADFIKGDRTSRRRKQIDALADERLFQLDLRNLAADGQGIAIKEALERRAIEQEIASEKAEFEKSVEQDKRKEKITSLRSEGSEARQQLIQQATDRKTDLDERNREAAQSRVERLQEEILQENEAFIQKKADLSDALTERNEAIRESEEERVAEIAKGLTEAEELTNAQLDRMIALAEEFGPKFGEIFADGMTKAFSENLKIDAAIEGASSGIIGAGSGGLPIATAEGSTAASSGGIIPFRSGGIIGSSGVGFLHKGEEVANPNEGQAIVIDGETFAVRAASQMAAAINSVMERNAQMIIDTVAAVL